MTVCRFTARAFDQFYTRTDVAAACVADLLELLGPSADNAIWIEPSAGGGAFLDHLPLPRIGLDLVPKRGDISRQDFLAWQPGRLTRRAIVVGNPPFGKNASLAQRFFNHATSFADVVAFIVPKTFKKDSLVNRLDRRMHLVKERDLPDDSFEFAGEPYHVPTVFQVWERRKELRALIWKVTSHPDFTFVPAQDAHFAFQRVGARAGLVSCEGLRKSPQSHYFIRANIDAERLFRRLASIDWNPVKLRTAGNPSIGKRELVHCYETACG